jgi:hypothetical protein
LLKLASRSSFHRVADDPASVIAKAAARLIKSKYHPNTMGIQFVQIGDEPDAKEALKRLVQGANGVRHDDRCVSHPPSNAQSQNIVDTVPYRGVLTPAELQRIVLGGLHPNIRALVPASWLANDAPGST